MYAKVVTSSESMTLNAQESDNSNIAVATPQ